ncbi:MAG: redoxin domain-containing protein [Anaerolineales bacterium]|nr:redoxin domain-containing protein [Anaerolineales bacterium]
MAQLRLDYDKFETLDTAIIVVGPEDAKSFASYMLENDLPFIGLPDPKHTVLKLYGQEIKLFKWGRMPAMLIVDKSGLVRFVHYGHDMSDIPDNNEVLKSIKNLNLI